MGSVNKAILVGNLGRDAELRYTTGGTAVANFSIATSESWNDKQTGERREHTEWHRICLWGPSAERLQQYLVRGKQICVEGRIQTRQWEDRDGNKRYTTEIRADRITLLGRRGDADEAPEQGPTNDSAGGGADAGGSAAQRPEIEDDDIPF